MAFLATLQRQLERIYELQTDVNVEDFLLTDQERLKALQPDAASAPLETLLVLQERDEIWLALYLDADLLDRLSQDNPHHTLHDGNLADYCVALEGVSHFLYLWRNAHFGRSVARLELELQAEIDKYIAASILCYRQRGGRIPSMLRNRLFDEAQFQPPSGSSLYNCYDCANRYADRYVRHLERCYLRRQQRADTTLVRDIRRFYRLPLRDKIRRIESIG